MEISEPVLYPEVLSSEARDFVAGLARTFEPGRREVLERRVERRSRLAAGERLRFLSETSDVRSGDWSVAPLAPGLEDRRVEITGPVDRKMIINALNSGAKAFMADFEDSCSPTWPNVVEGQANLIDAVAGTITLEAGGKSYSLRPSPATLLVRPRGWHLVEKHAVVDGQPVSASLWDFGLFFFHNARRLVESGRGPYVYLPKLESHLEARLWNDVFVMAQEAIGLPRGTIRSTVLIETLPAAFEMEEILYELREHSAGLNAGRWDYIFSTIKQLRDDPGAVLPDRSRVTMGVPFMRSYAELLVRTCHRRGAHAMGGMAAFIPSRRDEDVNRRAMAAVTADKEREARQGFDGTWVAHPDLVSVAAAAFDEVLGDGPHQIEKLREDVTPDADALLDVSVPDAAITEKGLRTNIRVGILYLASWLTGTGAAGLFNLMEDAATAEISRSQVWQWVRHGALLDDGRPVSADLVREVTDDEMGVIADLAGDGFESGRYAEAREIFEGLALAPEFEEFLTIPAYERI